MRTVLVILVMGVSVQAFSQLPSASEKLANELCPPHFSERQKVEAIFQWITGNISYNLRLERRKIIDEEEGEDDTSSTLRPLDHRVAETVIRRREAVCDGYARLFKSLCDHAGIRSERITGYARTSLSRSGERFRTNHSWNAVFIDSAWHLLDVTWASGYISFRADRFIRAYDPGYFLTPPSRFIEDHFPEDPKWTLLEHTPVPKEFARGPFRYGAFTTSRITSFLPSKGVIPASPGDTIRFEIESASRRLNEPNYMQVGDTFITDDPGAGAGSVGGNKLEALYVVPVNPPEWIFVSWNGETILRYRLAISQKLTAGLKQREED